MGDGIDYRNVVGLEIANPDSCISSVEEKYSGFFQDLEISRGEERADLEEIWRLFSSKRHSFRRKQPKNQTSYRELIKDSVEENIPIPVRVAWGYGKNPRFRDYHPSENNWSDPDLADIYTLAVIGDMLQRIPYPLDIMITGSWDRYLNINYYGIGRDPEDFLEDGSDNFERRFRSIVSELMPGIPVKGSYEFNEEMGIDLREEVGKPYVNEELAKLKKDEPDYVRRLVTSAGNHSVDPEASVNVYLRERIVEKRSNPNKITIQFGSASPTSFQYLTIPNRQVFDNVPSWEAKGAVVIGNGTWVEKMMSLKRLDGNVLVAHPRIFEIKNIKVNGLLYVEEGL